MHVRRGDFLTGACGLTDPEACFNHMTVYAEHVASVNKTLAAKGIHVPTYNVLVTSDESDPQWWKEVEDLGWHYTNHTLERTSEIYGLWYPSLLDAVTQSLAVGFVGTQFSTYSLVASRRVKDWRGGVAEFVSKLPPILYLVNIPIGHIESIRMIYHNFLYFTVHVVAYIRDCISFKRVYGHFIYINISILTRAKVLIEYCYA